MGYLCQWTMKRTGHPEPLVREVLDGAGRWLDEVATTLAEQRQGQEMSRMTTRQAQQQRKCAVDNACRS